MARASDFGKGLNGEGLMTEGADDGLLSIGNRTCAVLAGKSSFGDAVQYLVEDSKLKYNPTVEQVESLVRQSVLNLCPQHKNMLP